MGKDGRPSLVGKQVTTVQVAKQGKSIVREIGPDGKQVIAREVIYTYYEFVPVTTQVKIPLDQKGVAVFDPDGKRLEEAEVRKQLTRPVQVLVSADGKPIQRFYLQQHPGKFQVLVSTDGKPIQRFSQQYLEQQQRVDPIKAPPAPGPIKPEPIRREPRPEK